MHQRNQLRLRSTQWLTGQHSCVFALISGIALLLEGVQSSDYTDRSLSGLWSEGIGAASANNLIGITESRSMIANVLLVSVKPHDQDESHQLTILI